MFSISVRYVGKKNQIVRCPKVPWLPKIPRFHESNESPMNRKSPRAKSVEATSATKGEAMTPKINTQKKNANSNKSNESIQATKTPRKPVPKLLSEGSQNARNVRSNKILSSEKSISIPSSSKEADMIRAETVQRSLQPSYDKENDVRQQNYEEQSLQAQIRINAIAMQEIELLKAEREKILLGADKLVKERDISVCKYGRLLERYNYLVKKINGEGSAADRVSQNLNAEDVHQVSNADNVSQAIDTEGHLNPDTDKNRREENANSNSQ